MMLLDWMMGDGYNNLKEIHVAAKRAEMATLRLRICQ